MFRRMKTGRRHGCVLPRSGPALPRGMEARQSPMAREDAPHEPRVLCCPAVLPAATVGSVEKAQQYAQVLSRVLCCRP